MSTSNIKELATLLMETGHAHHQAFIKTDGLDPEWAIWYATYLQKPLSAFFNTDFTQSRIIYELIRLEEEADISQKPWPEVYAADLVKKYS